MMMMSTTTLFTSLLLTHLSISFSMIPFHSYQRKRTIHLPSTSYYYPSTTTTTTTTRKMRQQSQISTSEISALHDLYESTQGNSSWAWLNESEFGSIWDFSQDVDGSYLSNPCDHWQGIECITSEGGVCNISSSSLLSSQEVNEVCYISKINLFEYNLTGSVPDSLGYSLSRLQELTLWRNKLTNSIPSSLGLLTDLVLLDFDETG